jgi:hypothetical protein
LALSVSICAPAVDVRAGEIEGSCDTLCALFCNVIGEIGVAAFGGISVWLANFYELNGLLSLSLPPYLSVCVGISRPGIVPSPESSAAVRPRLFYDPLRTFISMRRPIRETLGQNLELSILINMSATARETQENEPSHGGQIGSEAFRQNFCRKVLSHKFYT